MGRDLEEMGQPATVKMAHLYDLCKVGMTAREDGSADIWSSAGAWEDMERMILSLQPDRVFVGGQAPTTQDACIKSHALVIGLPLKFINRSRMNDMSRDCLVVCILPALASPFIPRPVLEHLTTGLCLRGAMPIDFANRLFFVQQAEVLRERRRTNRKGIDFTDPYLYPISFEFSNRLVNHDNRRDFTPQDLVMHSPSV